MIVGVALGVLVGVVVTALALRRGRTDPVVTVAEVPPAVQPPSPVDAMLRAAVERLDLAVVVGTDDGTIAYRNRAATAMRGTHVGVIIDEHVDKALASAGRGERTDKRIDLHGPPRVSLELVAEPLEGGALVVLNDVSARTRIDAMRTDFVANISHELKTPVGAIAVLAEALEAEDDVEVVQRLSGRIVAESLRAVTTIDDLLELSRIESAPLADDVVELNQVIESAVARGRTADASRSVDVTAFGAGQRIRVRGDARQLESAIGNLVENAVKYSGDDGVVQVRTRADGPHVEVMVTDQGVGIPQRDLDRIFERFYRVDRARSRGTGGTGLGLSIVRHVASNHGGDVVVSSQEGEGSTFVLRLPSARLVTDDDGPGTDIDPAAAALERTGHD